MKRVYVNEEWCLGCRLCEYNCAFAQTGQTDMVKALKGKALQPNIRVEQSGDIHFAVSCRHCEQPLCAQGCISGALCKTPDGVVQIDADKCVRCYTCVLLCPYGAIVPTADGAVTKCELCLNTRQGAPGCVEGCPNRAIVYEQRGEER